MNRIVRENYPVADLPEDLREGLSMDGIVRVILEPHAAPPACTYDELMKLRQPPWLTTEQIQAQMDDVRDDRDL